MEFFVGKNGRQVGPLQEAEIRARIASGEFSGSDLVWRQGMSNWEPLDRIFGNPYQPSAALGDSPLLKNAGPGQYALAAPGTRLGAVLVDGLVGFLAFIPIFIGLAMNEGSPSDHTYPVGHEAGPTAMSLVMMGLGAVLLLGLMIWQLVLLSSKGQTLGKKVLGIRIVRFDTEANPGFVQAVLMRSVVPGLIGSVPIIGGIFSLVDVCYIFREDRRCIHDLMANTKVVQV